MPTGLQLVLENDLYALPHGYCKKVTITQIEHFYPRKILIEKEKRNKICISSCIIREFYHNCSDVSGGAKRVCSLK